MSHTYALKFFKTSYPEAKIQDELEMSEIVNTIRSKHFVRILPSSAEDYLILPHAMKCKFYKLYQGEGRKGFLLEYCKGQDLFDALCEKSFSEEKVVDIMREVAIRFTIPVQL